MTMASTHWRVLAAVSAISWGGYFIFDIPSSLSTSLSTHLNLPEHQFAYLISLLYTIYSIPNTVLPFLSGPAVQRFGERIVLLATISSIVLGQLLFALCLQAKLEFGLVAGRAFLGLGNEVIGVVGYEVVTRWFHDKGLSLALAINLGAGRLGSVANSVIVPRLTASYGIVSATWIATALALGVASISAVYLLSITQPGTDKTLGEDEGEDVDVDADKASFLTEFSLGQFPRMYWYLALLCPLSYGCQTFTNSAQRFLAASFYNGDQTAAGSAMSILFTVTGILVPLSGFMLDKLSSSKTSSSACALVASNTLLFVGHGLFLARTVSNPILPLCLLGTADALLCVAFWASVVRCLSPPIIDSRSEERTPLLKSADDEPILESFAELIHSADSDEEEGAAKSKAVSHSTSATRTFGMGIVSSLMNISATVVPVPLAVMENVAGFSGIEGVFVVLAFLGILGSLRLVWL